MAQRPTAIRRCGGSRSTKAQEETISSINGRGAFDEKACHEAFAQRSTHIVNLTQERQAIEASLPQRLTAVLFGGHA